MGIASVCRTGIMANKGVELSHNHHIRKCVFACCTLALLVDCLCRPSAIGRTLPSLLSTHEHKAQGKEITFKRVVVGEGVTKAGVIGVPVSLTTFEASDHVKLLAIFGDFDSSAAAMKELQLRLRDVAKIRKKSPKKNQKGSVVGQRVVAETKDQHSGKASFVIAWTNGSHLREIDSDSLEDALLLEKVYEYY
jgi:hypothetical protein